MFVQVLPASNEKGGMPGYFLNLGGGSRSLGMGRAYTGLTDDISAIYWNPAGLMQLNNLAMELSHVSLYENTRYNTAGFANKASDIWTYGVGIAQLYTDGIIKRDDNNTPGNETNDINTALIVANSLKLTKHIGVGLGVKMVNKMFDDYNSTWLGVDLGVLVVPVKNVTVGANIQNLIHSGGYPVPIIAKLGAAAKIIPEKLLLTGDIETVNDQLRFHAGIESRLINTLALRGGYDNGMLTAGLGLRVGNYSVDYAVLNHDEFGLSHRVSIIYTFKKPPETNRVTKNNKVEDTNYGIVDVALGKDDTSLPPVCEVKAIKEVPLAIYHLFTKTGISVVNVKINNPNDYEQKYRINYRFGTTNPVETHDVVVAGKTTSHADIVPVNIVDNTQNINAATPAMATLYVEIEKTRDNGKTKPVLKNNFSVSLLPYDQYTTSVVDANDKTFDVMNTIAGWVTYNDRVLTEVVNKASDRGSKQSPVVKIIGYQSPQLFSKPPNVDGRSMDGRETDFRAQVKLLYDTLKTDYGVKYINQPVSFGASQRVKLPAETLKNKGNCIELSVLFASLLESIEIDPILLLSYETGHSIVGWRVPVTDETEQPRYRFLETNLFGEDFEKVYAKGQQLINDYGLANELANGKTITFDDIGFYGKNDAIVMYDIRKLHQIIPPAPYLK